jgi:hypothetical protein
MGDAMTDTDYVYILSVKEVLDSEWAFTTEDGTKVGHEIIKYIERGSYPVGLSFKEIRSVTGVFLHTLSDVFVSYGVLEDNVHNYVEVIGSSGRELLFKEAVRIAYDYRRRPEFYDAIFDDDS